MNIYGLQKLTLLDYPGHTACTVFLGGCNFRCLYCHNKDIVECRTKPISESNFFAWLEKRKGLLDGVCISGGEPTLHERLNAFVYKIKDMGFLVKLDTNGSKPSALLSPRYDYIAMDIKNGFRKYSATAGTEVSMGEIYQSIEAVKKSKDYEFRTTVTGSLHSIDDFLEIGEMIRGAKRYFLQICTSDPPTDEDVEQYAEVMKHFVEYVGVRG